MRVAKLEKKISPVCLVRARNEYSLAKYENASVEFFLLRFFVH